MKNELLGKLGILSVAVVLATAGLSACKGDDDGEAGDDEVGDGDGDDTTGDGDGDDMTGDGDGDGDETGDGDGDETGDGDGDEVLDCPTHDPGDGADIGEACYSNGDCASKVCERFQDVPPVDGTCAPTTDECRTRFMGRVLDFTTRETVEGADLRAVQAIMASVDPVGAPGEATGTSDADGIIDTTSDGQVSAPLGVVGLAEADGYYLTATGLASPAEGNFYGPANTIRDIWVVPADALSDWSGYLDSDPDFTDQLPLGEAGGVVGLVRDTETGEPVANAVVVPSSPDTSGAVIRYLNEDGSDFVSDMTSSQGVFVIVKPGLGETFGVEVDNTPVDGVSGTAGSAKGAIFTLIMNI
ncbi:MAG: hypothetical protein R6X02_34105 [Enhygromyxa sp.]